MPLSKLHAAARAYAEASWPVFPIVPNAKNPLTAHGFKEATTDLATIDLWWGTYFPEANIGFEPDSVGLCVIDIDLGAKIPIGVGFAYGRKVTTPSGGAHLYYAGSLPPTQSKIAPKIDTRGQKSYVLLPPSIINGVEYLWEHDKDFPFSALDIPPIANAIVEICAPSTNRMETIADADLDTPYAIKKAREFLARMPIMDPDDPAGDDYANACRVLRLGCSVETGIRLATERGADEDWATLKFENAEKYIQDEGVEEQPIHRLAKAGFAENTEPQSPQGEWTPHWPRDPQTMPELEFFDNGQHDPEVT